MAIRKVSAVMLDMDGVLIASREIIEYAWIEVCRKWGISITDQIIHRDIHGRPGSYTAGKLFAHLSEEERKQAKHEVDMIEEEAYTPLIAGVRDYLDMVQAAQISLALVTSSWPKRVMNVLNMHGLQDTFSVIVTRDQIIDGKPSPDSYLYAARMLEINPGNCLVFEDSLSGIQAATSSGAVCISIQENMEAISLGVVASFADFRGVYSISRRSNDQVLMNVSDNLELIIECSSHCGNA